MFDVVPFVQLEKQKIEEGIERLGSKFCFLN